MSVIVVAQLFYQRLPSCKCDSFASRQCQARTTCSRRASRRPAPVPPPPPTTFHITNTSWMFHLTTFPQTSCFLHPFIRASEKAFVNWFFFLFCFFAESYGFLVNSYAWLVSGAQSLYKVPGYELNQRFAIRAKFRLMLNNRSAFTTWTFPWLAVHGVSAKRTHTLKTHSTHYTLSAMLAMNTGHVRQRAARQIEHWCVVRRRGGRGVH